MMLSTIANPPCHLDLHQQFFCLVDIISMEALVVSLLRGRFLYKFLPKHANRTQLSTKHTWTKNRKPKIFPRDFKHFLGLYT